MFYSVAMLHLLIMAGGSGTRFWPVSRKLKPKQFLKLISEAPLIEHTVDRFDHYIPFENRWVLGSTTHTELLTCLDGKVPHDHILLEPVSRNTAACIGWGAQHILQKDPDAIIIVLPSDHWIDPTDGLIKTLKLAVEEVAQSDSILTVGIRPSFAHTGYGYIQTLKKQNIIYTVNEFKEKPDKETAEAYLKAGNYFWNSGMFIWKAKTILSLFEEHLPNHAKILNEIESNPENTLEIFKKFDNISIDYGIMEKASDKIKMVEAQFQWSDVGSWPTMAQFLEKDANNNAHNGPIIAIDSNNNIIYSEKKLTAIACVHDKIIVDTEDALMIVPRNVDHYVSTIYNELDSTFQ